MGSEDSEIRSRRVLLSAATDLLPWLVIIAALLAVAVRLVVGHWLPTSDEATITTLAADTGTSHTQTLGMPTSLSLSAGEILRHPGPIQFWLLGPPARLLGAPGAGIALGTTMIYGLLLLLTAVSARHLRPRAMGPAASIVAAILMIEGLSHEGAVSPFNTLPLVPAAFGALVSFCAFVQGHRRSLLMFVATASVAAQVHVTGLPTMAPFVIATAVAIAVDLRRLPKADAGRRQLTRVTPAAIALGLILWSGPIYDQLFGTGNLWNLATNQSANPPLGFGFAFDRLVTLLWFRPSWTENVYADISSEPTITQIIGVVCIIGLLVAAAAIGLHRRQRQLVAWAATALTALAAATFTTSLLPDTLYAPRPPNRTLWWPTGAFVWLASGAVLVMLLRPVVERRTTALRSMDRIPTWSGAAIATVAVVLLAVPYVPSTDPSTITGSAVWGPTRQFREAILAQRPPGGTVRIKAPGINAQSAMLAIGLVAQMRLDGVEVQIDMLDPLRLYAALEDEHPADRDADVIVYVRDSDQATAAPEGARLISTWDPANPTPAFRGYDRPPALVGGIQRARLYLIPPDSPAAAPFTDQDREQILRDAFDPE